MITDMRLVLGSDQLSLWDREDLWVGELDVAFPEVREQAEDRTETDGTEDRTVNHGAAAVSLTVRLQGGTDATVLDSIKRFMHPQLRPYLYVADSNWQTERRLRLRSRQASSPFQMPMYPIARDVQIQWSAPDGVWESADLVSQVVNVDSAGGDGRTYSLTPPRSYPGRMPTGAVIVVNPGGSWSEQKVRMYGPCRGPRFTNDLTGETISFTEDLQLALGDYIEVNTAARTALLASNIDASRLQYLDYSVSSWWRLAPGVNAVRYHPISGVDPGCQAVVEYRPTWL